MYHSEQCAVVPVLLKFCNPNPRGIWEMCSTYMPCDICLTKHDVLNQIFKYLGQICIKIMISDAVHYVQRVPCVFLHLSFLCTTNMWCLFWSKLDVLNRIFKYSVPNRQKNMFWDAVHYVQRVSCAFLHLSLLCTTNMCC